SRISRARIFHQDRLSFFRVTFEEEGACSTREGWRALVPAVGREQNSKRCCLSGWTPRKNVRRPVSPFRLLLTVRDRCRVFLWRWQRKPAPRLSPPLIPMIFSRSLPLTRSPSA